MRNSSLTQEENTKSGQTKRYTHENTKTQTFSLSSKDVLYTVVVCYLKREVEMKCCSLTHERRSFVVPGFLRRHAAHTFDLVFDLGQPLEVFFLCERKNAQNCLL